MKLISVKKTLCPVVFAALILGPSGAWAEDCPMHAEHQKSAARQDGVSVRGDEAMGFDHAKTTHHFLLEPDGGGIRVEASDPSDTVNRDAVRKHLGDIAGQFTDGNFQVPMFIHDQVPPGVPVMKQKRNAITYTYEPTERGGRVRITTRDADALAAVHSFLKFQILDHRTGDPTDVSTAR